MGRKCELSVCFHPVSTDLSPVPLCIALGLFLDEAIGNNCVILGGGMLMDAIQELVSLALPSRKSTVVQNSNDMAS